MLSTSVFVAALLTVLVAIATTTALPAAPGQLVYYQQMRPLYQPYRAYQPQYHHQHQATSNNKYALRRSAEQLGANDGAAFAQDDEPFVLGDGEIAVGSPSADAPNTYADEPAYYPQPQADDDEQLLPSFQGDPEQVNAVEQQDAPEQFADAAAPAATPNRARRPASSNKKQTAAAAVPHTFFPMTFGSTGGGTVAVANSFSTGKGSAASHAVAYGRKQ